MPRVPKMNLPQRQHAGHRQEHADDGGEHDEQHDAGLAEFVEIPPAGLSRLRE